MPAAWQHRRGRPSAALGHLTSTTGSCVAHIVRQMEWHARVCPLGTFQRAGSWSNRRMSAVRWSSASQLAATSRWQRIGPCRSPARHRLAPPHRRRCSFAIRHRPPRQWGACFLGALHCCRRPFTCRRCRRTRRTSRRRGQGSCSRCRASSAGFWRLASRCCTWTPTQRPLAASTLLPPHKPPQMSCPSTTCLRWTARPNLPSIAPSSTPIRPKG
mmetsp:Transcript_17468/g.29715  ORF Transcript_17468/g.29715 Transcript_17468/m.29715 type:complete len:215 (-) Transcript_17468:2084-2728(-)